MKTSIAFVLISLFWLACKKDSKPPFAFKGIVLRRADLSPVANARVGVAVIKPDDPLYASNTGSFITNTDAKGMFRMAIGNNIDSSLIEQYYTVARKKGMVQLRSTYRRTLDQFLDTILLDDASYLKMEITIKTPPVGQQSLYLSWDFLKTSDTPAIGKDLSKGEELYSRFPTTSFTIIDSFSHYERPRLFTELIIMSPTESKRLSGKDILLQKQDTNYVKIEY
jgi:hypothetical protein